MKQTPIAATIALTMAMASNVHADSTEQRLARMEAMLAEMQQRLDAQSDKIKQQEATIEQQKQALEGSTKTSGGDAWFQKVEVGGLIEVEASHTSPYTGDDESDIVLATFELGISSQVTDWVEAGGSLLYEEDDTDLEVDIAYITIANADASPLFLTAGQIYVPFGAFETNMVSDPLTLEIGETRESTVQVGFQQGGLGGSLYLFNGTNQKNGENEIDAWGANLGYGQESGNMSWAAGIGYISDLGDSDTLQDVIADNLGSNDISERVGGWTVNAGFQFGGFNVIGEYLAASDTFESAAVPWRLNGAEPEAWNIEAGYSFDLMGRGATLAIAYQGTEQALALELPERRLLLGFSIDILENAALGLEWAHDDDYDVEDGGTGESADTVTAQLAVEF